MFSRALRLFAYCCVACFSYREDSDLDQPASSGILVTYLFSLVHPHGLCRCWHGADLVLVDMQGVPQHGP